MPLTKATFRMMWLPPLLRTKWVPKTSSKLRINRLFSHRRLRHTRSTSRRTESPLAMLKPRRFCTSEPSWLFICVSLHVSNHRAGLAGAAITRIVETKGVSFSSRRWGWRYSLILDFPAELRRQEKGRASGFVVVTFYTCYWTQSPWSPTAKEKLDEASASQYWSPNRLKECKLCNKLMYK